MRRVVAAAILLLGAAASACADEGEPLEWLKALRLRGRLAEEFAYRLHDPGDVSKLIVRILAIILAVVIWFFMDLPVFRRKAMV